MRPVRRPPYAGQPVTNYQSYLQPLMTAFGTYCSYCECLGKFDVEHVAPKSLNPALITDWNNMLLGCMRCNRDFKKNKNDSRQDYVWPDTHNTYTLLKYWPDGRVHPAAGLANPLLQEVQNTIDLVCLDDSQQPQSPLNLARKKQFDIASRVLGYYRGGNSTLDDILLFASVGHWSVWYTVFQPHQEVLTALETLHPNTAMTRL